VQPNELAGDLKEMLKNYQKQESSAGLSCATFVFTKLKNLGGNHYD